MPERLNAALSRLPRLARDARPWLLAIAHGGAIIFALNVMSRADPLRRAGLTAPLDKASPVAWGMTYIIASLIGLLVLWIDPRAVWVPHGVSLLLFAIWAGLVVGDSWHDTDVSFPVASVVVSWAFAAVMFTDPHPPRFRHAEGL